MSGNDYKIGYKKPPLDTQFKTGQSGNPKGRPKGVKNLATDLQEELEQKIQITEANQTQVVTKQRAMLKTMFAKALKGESRAATALIKLIVSLEKSQDDVSNQPELAADDLAILEAFKDKLISEHNPT